MVVQQSRGYQATKDMKVRIAALKESDADVIDVLWERYRTAVLGSGFDYEFIDEKEDSKV